MGTNARSIITLRSDTVERPSELGGDDSWGPTLSKGVRVTEDVRADGVGKGDTVILVQDLGCAPVTAVVEDVQPVRALMGGRFVCLVLDGGDRRVLPSESTVTRIVGLDGVLNAGMYDGDNLVSHPEGMVPELTSSPA